MPKYDRYFGLHVADLDRFPDRDVHGLKQTERNIVRVPRFSRIVAKHVRQRLVKPRRRVITDGFINQLFIDTVGAGENVLPIPAYVRLMNFCNRLLLNSKHPGKMLSMFAIESFDRRCKPQHNILCHRFCVNLDDDITNIITYLETTSLKNAARVTNNTFSFHPYWRSANNGKCVVVTSTVYGILCLLAKLNEETKLLKTQALYGYGKHPFTIHSCLRELCQTCPQTFSRYCQVAIRQLKYTKHLTRHA